MKLVTRARAVLAVGVAVVLAVGAFVLLRADERTPPAVYATGDGTLLDGDLRPVGRLRFGPGALGDVAPDGRLVFTTDREATLSWDCCGPNKRVIYVADPGGKAPRRLLDGEADQAPDWSSDGARVAFLRRNGSGTPGSDSLGPLEHGVYIYDVRGAVLRPFVLGDRYGAPRWSPNGRFIAVTTYDEDEPAFGVEVRDARTGDVAHRVPATGPGQWSPDGDRLAYTASGSGAIAVYDLGSRTAHELPRTATKTSDVVVWGDAGLYVRLNRGGGRSVLALVRDGRGAPVVVRHCRRHQPCPDPSVVLP